MNKKLATVLASVLLQLTISVQFANAASMQSVKRAGDDSVSLEDQLKTLDVENQAPAAVSTERLYAIQSRYAPLRHKNELLFGAASNLTGDSFLVTRQIELGYYFHFNDRWSLGADYAFVSNQFSSAADKFKESDGAIPDVPFAKNRADLMVAFNLFYGKFRLTADRVFYFDQYLALGPGLVQMNNGQSTAAVGDAGFAFWLGRWGSAHLGIKDYYYTETYRTSRTASHNFHAHLDVGVLF